MDSYIVTLSVRTKNSLYKIIIISIVAWYTTIFLAPRHISYSRHTILHNTVNSPNNGHFCGRSISYKGRVSISQGEYIQSLVDRELT